MVMIGSFGAHIVHGFFLYAIGILNVAFLENFQEDVGKTSWACGIHLGLFSLTGTCTLSDWYAFCKNNAQQLLVIGVRDITGVRQYLCLFNFKEKTL